MANKVEILNLDINTNALISKMTETRAEIDRLKAAQKSLSDSNQTNSDSFTKNEVAIKRLQTSYATQKNVVTQLTTAQTAFATATTAISSAIDKENSSITSARENNKQLLTLRNELNLKTIEGQTALAGINAKLDQNNAYIKENVSGYEKQKIGIGDYRTQITGALQDSGLFGGKIQSVTQSLQSFSGVFGIMKNEVKSGTDQIRNSAVATEGMTTAQKALAIATGIGTGAMRIFTVALAATGIGLIIAAVALLIGYFKTFDPIVDKLEQGFAALGAAVRVVQQAFAGLFDSTEDSSKSFGELGSNMAKAAKDAAKLKAASQDLNDAQKAQEVTNNRASQQYDELILKSKNKTLTEKERIAFLKQADAIETANYKQRSALAEIDLKQSIEAARIKGNLSNQELANLKRNTVAYGTYLLNQGKITDKELDGLIKSENGKIAIKAESTKRLEKIANTTDKLNEDAAAKREKASQDAESANQKRIAAEQKRIQEYNKSVDAGLLKSKEQIDLYVAQEATKQKSAEDTLLYEKNLLTKRLALNEEQHRKLKISDTAFEAERLKLTNEFEAKKTAAKQVELERIKSFEDKKTALQNQLDIYRATTQAGKDSLKLTQDLEKHLAELEDIKLKETEKAELKKLLLEQYNLDVAVITDNAAAVAAQKKADFDVQAINYEKTKNEVHIGLAQQLGSTLLGLLGDSLGGQLAAIAFDAIIQIAKLKIATSAAQAINLANGTALSIPTGGASVIAAKATNIGLGVSSKLQQASIIGAAAISGVGAILKKVPKKAEGGIIPTLGAGVINNGANVIPLSNGDNTLAYVKQGEVILNEQQQRLAGGSNFFKSLGIPGFNGGGLVGGNSNLGSLNGFKIDYDVLAYKVAQANRMLPAPVVSVTDISYQQNRVAVIENGANL